MNTINPYIAFNGKCREAMTFYQNCLGGDLELQEVKDSPMQQNWTGPVDQVFHASLVKDGNILVMGSDMIDQAGYQKGTNMAMAVGCDSEENIRTLFAKISEEGKVFHPLTEQFWGAMFASVEDKYGIRWMLNYNRKKP